MALVGEVGQAELSEMVLELTNANSGASAGRAGAGWMATDTSTRHLAWHRI
jgi:hypothetical protein